MAEAGDEIGLMWCCNFPNFIYTKKSDSKKKLYALFKNNSYRHYKGIQLPNAAGLSGSKKCWVTRGTHSSLVRLKTTSLNSISLVMNGFHLWPNISYYPTPAASGSSILLQQFLHIYMGRKTWFSFYRLLMGIEKWVCGSVPSFNWTKTNKGSSSSGSRQN